MTVAKKEDESGDMFYDGEGNSCGDG